jgi:hypothetical protein
MCAGDRYMLPRRRCLNNPLMFLLQWCSHRTQHVYLGQIIEKKYSHSKKWTSSSLFECGRISCSREDFHDSCRARPESSGCVKNLTLHKIRPSRCGWSSIYGSGHLQCVEFVILRVVNISVIRSVLQAAHCTFAQEKRSTGGWRRVC